MNFKIEENSLFCLWNTERIIGSSHQCSPTSLRWPGTQIIRSSHQLLTNNLALTRNTDHQIVSSITFQHPCVDQEHRSYDRLINYSLTSLRWPEHRSYDRLINYSPTSFRWPETQIIRSSHQLLSNILALTRTQIIRSSHQLLSNILALTRNTDHTIISSITLQHPCVDQKHRSSDRLINYSLTSLRSPGTQIIRSSHQLLSNILSLTRNTDHQIVSSIALLHPCVDQKHRSSDRLINCSPTSFRWPETQIIRSSHQLLSNILALTRTQIISSSH